MILKKNFKKCMGIGDGEDSGMCLLIDYREYWDSLFQNCLVY